MPQTPIQPDHESPPSAPRWVKLFGIVALVLVLLFVILHLTGNGFGGPGMHGLPAGAVESWMHRL